MRLSTFLYLPQVRIVRKALHDRTVTIATGRERNFILHFISSLSARYTVSLIERKVRERVSSRECQKHHRAHPPLSPPPATAVAAKKLSKQRNCDIHKIPKRSTRERRPSLPRKRRRRYSTLSLFKERLAYPPFVIAEVRHRLFVNKALHLYPVPVLGSQFRGGFQLRSKCDSSTA